MNVALVFLIVIIILFVLAYVTKRRFGVLGLALAAGSMLSGLWAEKVVPLVREAGLTAEQPLLITLVSAAIVLLPAVVLLFSGPSYRDVPRRIAGALLFAALAFAFLVEPLGSMLVLQGQGKQMYDFIVQNQVYIVTLGLIVSIIDLLMVHTSSHRRRDVKH